MSKEWKAVIIGAFNMINTIHLDSHFIVIL